MASLKLLLTTFTLLLMFLSEINAQAFQSPCPHLFKYDLTTNETDKWYGTLILLSTESDLLDIWVRLTFDRTSLQLGNWFGQVETTDGKEYHIKKNNYELKANVPQTFRFFLRYNPNVPAPRLLSFRLNGKLVCSNETVIKDSTTFTNRLNTNQFDTNNRANQLSSTPRDVLDNQGSGTNNRDIETRDRINSQANNKIDTNEISTQASINSRDRVNFPLVNSQNIVQGNNQVDSTNSRDRVNIRPNNNSQDINSRVTPTSTSSRNKPDINSRDRVSSDAQETQSNRIVFPSKTITDSPNRVNTEIITSFLDKTISNAQNSGIVTSSGNGLENNVRDKLKPQFSNSSFLGDSLNTWISPNTPDRFDNIQINSTSPSQDTFSTHSQEEPIISNPIRDEICGTIIPQATPLIAYGEITHEGEFPWHSALYIAKSITLTYICGASLISKEYVITTAHCVIRRKPQESLQPRDLIIQLGKYNLKRFSVGYQDRLVSEIISHPEFNAETYLNNIALLKLATLANITEYVRPICLWQEAIDIKFMINKIGKVVGWGYDETGKVTDELMQAKMPIVPKEKCISSYPDFYNRFTSTKCYCAGYANGTSPCNGDAGGGMVFPITSSNRRNPVWHLRGIVSILPSFQNQILCDVTHYTIFTDVAMHLDWITASMK